MEGMEKSLYDKDKVRLSKAGLQNAVAQKEKYLGSNFSDVYVARRRIDRLFTSFSDGFFRPEAPPPCQWVSYFW